MKTNFLMSRKLLLAFGAAILDLVVVGAIFYCDTARFSEGTRCVRYTRASRVGQLMGRNLSCFNSAEEFKWDRSMGIFP